MPAVSSSARWTFQAYSPSIRLGANTWAIIEAMIAAVLACGMTLHIVSGLPQLPSTVEHLHDVVETPSRSPISWLILTSLTSG